MFSLKSEGLHLREVEVRDRLDVLFAALDRLGLAERLGAAFLALARFGAAFFADAVLFEAALCEGAVFFAADRLDEAAPFAPPLFLADPPFAALPFFAAGVFFDVALFGTFLPSLRASFRPMAIACLRLCTFFPERPDLSVPACFSCIALCTFSEAPRLYVRLDLAFAIQRRQASCTPPALGESLGRDSLHRGTLRRVRATPSGRCLGSRLRCSGENCHDGVRLCCVAARRAGARLGGQWRTSRASQDLCTWLADPGSMTSARERTRFFVAECLREIAELIRLRDGRAYPALAYRRAALTLEGTSSEQFEALHAVAGWEQLRGVGPSIASQISALLETGSSPLLGSLREQFPRSLLELTRLRGVSLLRAQRLRAALGVESLEALERACLEHRVQSVRGFGPKTEAELVRAIAQYRSKPAHLRSLEVLPLARALQAHLLASVNVQEARLAGALRRGEETTDEIRLVVVTRDLDAMIEHLSRFSNLMRLQRSAAAQATGRLANGLDLIVTATLPDQLEQTLFRETGPDEHVAEVLARARSHGAIDAPMSEGELYAAAQLPYLEPELRDDPDCLWLRSFDAPALVSAADVRGAVHCHTDYSDGRASVLEMARAARALGLEYITITDHSPSAHYAGGVSTERLLRQWEEIAEAEQQVGIRILRGTESDILADGALDYPDDVIEQLDLVIASVHSRFRMDRRAMTERLRRVLELPVFKVWGHPLGRLVLRREPIDCDVEALLDVIASSPAAIEINGDPFRLDLPSAWVRRARARGIPFVLSSDAHSSGALSNYVHGVTLARRGGLAASDVLNTLDATTFMQRVRPSRRSHHAVHAHRIE